MNKVSMLFINYRNSVIYEMTFLDRFGKVIQRCSGSQFSLDGPPSGTKMTKSNNIPGYGRIEKYAIDDNDLFQDWLLMQTIAGNGDYSELI